MSRHWAKRLTLNCMCDHHEYMPRDTGHCRECGGLLEWVRHEWLFCGCCGKRTYKWIRSDKCASDSRPPYEPTRIKAR